MVRAMVHSVKHYAQVTFSTAGTGATAVFTPITAVASASANTNTEVVEGARIKAIYMEMWLVADAVDNFFTAIVAKLPGGVGNITNADLVSLFDYDNKKNVFYTTQGLAPQESASNPIPIYKGWIKIPKGKQRFGLGDRLQFGIASRGADNIHFCGFFLYKEYT